MSGQPCHDLRHGCRAGAGRYGGAVDHYDRDLQAAGGVEFGARARAACVLGDDMGDAVIAQKGGVGGFGERAFGEDDRRVGQGKRGFGFVHQSQQIVVLRFGGKGVQGLLADGQKHAGGTGGKRDCRLIGVGNMGPAVGIGGGPRRAFKGDERGFRGRAGGDSIGADAGGKGVGGVDHMGDPFGFDITGKAFGAAEASGSGGQGLGYGGVGASGVGKDGIYACGGKFAGQKAGFGGAAEKKDARHG